MIRPRPATLPLAALAIWLWTGGGHALAEARPGRVEAVLSVARGEGTETLEVEADRMEQTREGDALLEGNVTIRYGDARMHADRIRFRGKRYLEAEGNVLIVWGPNRIAGSRMGYDLAEERGIIEDAVGQVEPEFFFTAEQAETLGKDLVLLDSATVTTCTQPVPYWSFSVSSARVRLGGYAHLWNLRLKAGVVPVFYLPYLLWPVKRDRAAGLLLTEFGSSNERGFFAKQDVFVPLGPSADLTAFAIYYEKAGLGGGGEFRIVPNEAGVASVSGFFIDDELSGEPRYRVTIRQAQEFLNGFRMVTDVSQVSDFDFFSDFETDLRLSSSPTILGRIEFTRNGAWTSVNVRDLRREQLFAGGGSVVQRTLPEVEWRGRNRRLGRTPLYVSFESSAAWIQQSSPDSFANYYRVDAFPRISAAVSPVPWLDITPEVGYRATYYTQRKDPLALPGSGDVVVDDPLTRAVGSGRIEVVGPKLSRIFRREGDLDAAMYKNTIEARVAYTYQQGAKRANEVLLYDDVDTEIAAQSFVVYGLRTRLFARRPRSEASMAPASYEQIVLPDGTSRAAPFVVPEEDGPGPRPEEIEQAPQEPVEILSVELQQRRSLDEALSRADVDGDGVLETSQSSPVDLVGRYRPTDRTDLSLRASYDFLGDELANLTLSGGTENELFRTAFSVVRQGASQQTQVRLLAGVNLLGGRLRLDSDGAYALNAPPGQNPVLDQRWRMELYSQCCGLLLEYHSSDFQFGTARNTFRFSLDLRGIGKLLDEKF